MVLIGLHFLPTAGPGTDRDAPADATSLPPEALGLDPETDSGNGAAAVPPAQASPSDVLSLARSYGPWDEEPPPLRGVEGLVRDAKTRQPIAGAWITWRLPPPAVVDRVLEDQAFLDRRFTMVSDGRGRFAVDRLPDDVPLSTTIFAVARGYAYAAVTVGLSRELTIDLVPMGTLEVTVRGERTPEVTLTAAGKDALLTHLPTWGDAPGVFRLSHLEPGTYTVQLDRDAQGPSAQVTVVAGQVARLELRGRRWQPLRGNLAFSGQLLPNRELVVVHEATFARTLLRTDRFGRFEIDLHPGRYALFFMDKTSERRIPGFVEPGQGEAPVEVALPSAALTLRLTRSGAPLRSTTLGLVRLDAPLTSLVAPDTPREPGVYRVAGEPGQYALFDDSTYWGQVGIPGSLTLDLTPRTLQVELGLDGLLEGEVVRGEVALLPPTLFSARPDLVEMQTGLREPFTASVDRSTLVLPLGRPGTYVLYGRSDLGPFRHEVELLETSPVVRCELPLIPSR